MGSRILITGASSDVGLQLIQRLAQKESGLSVIAHTNRGTDRLQTLQDAFPNVALQIVQADLSTESGIASLLEAVSAQELPHRFLHLPALPYKLDRFTKFNWSSFEQDLAIQLRSLVAICGLLVPAMADRCAQAPTVPNGKVVVMLSSVTVGAPPKYSAAYTACKYAVWGVLRVLAAEYSDRRVNINGVSPQMMQTRFIAALPSKAVELASAQSPSGRLATPGDVVPLIELLLTADSDYMSGANFPITAGMPS